MLTLETASDQSIANKFYNIDSIAESLFTTWRPHGWVKRNFSIPEYLTHQVSKVYIEKGK